MTTHTRMPQPVPDRVAGHYINRDHTVTGTATQLANIVANHRNAGTLVALTTPRPVGNRLQVVIRLREYQPTRPITRVTSVVDHVRTRIRRPRRTRIAVIVTTVTGTIVGLLAVGAFLLGQLVELITTYGALLLGISGLALGLAVAARRRSSGRRHCPGC